jgi:hypothetical protein
MNIVLSYLSHITHVSCYICIFLHSVRTSDSVCFSVLLNFVRLSFVQQIYLFFHSVAFKAHGSGGVGGSSFSSSSSGTAGGGVCSLHWCARSRQLVTAGRDGTVKVWAVHEALLEQ